MSKTELDIPMINVKIIGQNPMLMHSERGVNVLDPLVKQKKAITAKRKKTDDDLEAICRLEWEISLYHDDDIGPFIPGQNIEACIVEGAKLEKRGKDIARGVSVPVDKIKLNYAGPRDKEKMWASGKFSDEIARLSKLRGMVRKEFPKLTPARPSEAWHCLASRGMVWRGFF